MVTFNSLTNLMIKKNWAQTQTKEKQHNNTEDLKDDQCIPH